MITQGANMKRRFLNPLSAVLFACVMFSFLARAEEVTIAQFVSHPALDAMVEGILEELKTQPDLEINIENAQGTMAVAVQVAQKVLSYHPKVVISLATPLTQTFSQVLKGQKIPVVFGAVTDPVEAHIPAGDPETPIFGVIDQPPLADQMNLIKECLPNVKKVGIPYSSGEVNSVAIVEYLKGLTLPFELVFVPLAKSSELVTALKAILPEVQAIYLPQDNAVISATEVALATAHAAGVPSFTSVTEIVEKGALAALGYNFTDMGRDVGKMALQILKGQVEGLKPVQRPSKSRLWINMKVAQHYNLTLDADLLKRADRLFK